MGDARSLSPEGSAAGKAPDGPEPWRLYLWIAFVALIIAAMIGYGVHEAHEMGAVEAPLVDAVMEIKVELADAFLLFERARIQGGEASSREAIRSLDRAVWYAGAMLEGGENEQGEFFPLEVPENRQKVADLRQEMAELRRIMEEMLAPGAAAGETGEPARRYVEISGRLLRDLDGIEAAVKKRLAWNLKRFHATRALLLVLCLFFAVYVAVLLRRFHKAQSNHIDAISQAYDDLVREMAERKAAEEKLRLEKERAQTYLDIAGVMIVALERDQTVSLINKKGCEILGREAEEILGRNWFENFLPERLREEVKEVFDKLATGEIEEVEYFENPVVNARGEERLVDWRNAFLKDDEGEIKTILSSGLDITERRRAAEALAAEKERLAVTLRSIGDGVITTDPQGRVVLLNAIAEELTGWTQSEAAGRRLEEVFHIVNEHTRERCVNPVDKVMETGGIVGLANDTVLISRTGEERIIADSGSPIRDAEGGIVGVVLVFRDVTEKTRLEERLQQSARMEAIGQLAGGVAHDFNNLLLGVMGYASLLKLQIPPESGDYEAIQVIEKSADRMAELTRQLLGFARRGKHRIEPVDLHETIHEVAALLSRTIDKNIDLSLKLGARQHTVLGDPGQMHQVLLNLAINARDAMPEGGELTFATEVAEPGEEFRAPRSLEKPGPYLKLEVRDTGCGMPREVQAHIFEPFFTTKGPGEGTGMGLATVYGVVKNHDGAVDVYSEEGRGSVFRILFPLAAGEAESREEREEEDLAGSGRILVVDDEEIVLKTAGDMLRVLGYEVVLARGGREAVEIYRQKGGEIDLVVIDMVMPAMDGRECFQALKALNPGLRAILSTGYGLDGKAQEILDEGMVGFLQKPYELRAVARKLKEVL